MKGCCAWPGDDSLSKRYHDEEWGVPCRDDAKLFEFIILESAQAGLSWITILHKRENYRHAFSEFNFDLVSQYTSQDVERLRADIGIVRNKMKIDSAIQNARCFKVVRSEFGSFSDYLWGFTDGTTVVNHWRSESDIPSQTKLSKFISDDMRQKGFEFFGPTICYAYLQAIGIVNDHLEHCFRWGECQEL